MLPTRTPSTPCSSALVTTLVAWLRNRKSQSAPVLSPYRAGTVPYRNDDKAAARRDDALRKIAKFCGSDGYTVIREGSSPTASNVSEVDFRCGQGPTVSASVGALAQPKNSAIPGGTPITANPNVAPTPSDFDRP